MTDTLLASWRQYLSSSDAGLHLVDSHHPLQFFIGKSDTGRPRIVIRSDVKPQMLTLSNVVLIDRFEDQSGKWNISFALQDEKFDEVFLRLADDMHSRSAGAPNEQVALDRVGVVVDEWRRLLKARASGVLSMEELRGLVGEMWLLLSRFSDTRSMTSTIDGWLGPMGLPQDFWYAESGYHEAKSIGPATTKLKISSEYQLDAEELELLILFVGNCDERVPGALNLPTLVARVMAQLAAAGDSDEAFQLRLQRLGVDASQAFYQDTWFVVERVSAYDAGGEFPAIRASSLSTGISRVTYQIELAQIAEFLRSTTEVV